MKTIILDAGHGITTPGKRSPVWADGTQLREWEFTRDIVKRIADALADTLIPVHRLVVESADVPIFERARMANKIAAKVNGDALLVSVHANAAAKPNTASGWEVWTSLGKTKSDALADVFWQEAANEFNGRFPMRGDTSDGDKDWDGNFAILRATTCPAILTENLFMDNERDCRFMMSEEGRAAIARLHVNAILKIVEQ